MANGLSNADKLSALEMHERGASIEEIALTLNVPVALVTPFIREANKALVPQHPDDKMSEVGRQIRIFNGLAKQLIKDFAKSHGVVETIKVVEFNAERQDGEAFVLKSRVEKTYAPQNGDPAIVRELRGVMGDIRKMVALDAPRQVDVSVSGDGSPRVIQFVEVVEPSGGSDGE